MAVVFGGFDSGVVPQLLASLGGLVDSGMGASPPARRLNGFELQMYEMVGAGRLAPVPLPSVGASLGRLVDSGMGASRLAPVPLSIAMVAAMAATGEGGNAGGGARRAPEMWQPHLPQALLVSAIVIDRLQNRQTNFVAGF